MEFTDNQRDLIAHAVMALTVADGLLHAAVGRNVGPGETIPPEGDDNPLAAARVTVRDALSQLGEALNDCRSTAVTPVRSIR